MGTFKDGFWGNYRGKIGNLVFYVVKGKQRVRTIGKTSIVPPTPAQLQNRSEIGVVVHFLKPLKEFINVGFKLKAKKKSLAPHNVAVSYNKLHAVTGTYPDVTIAYDKVLVTQGSMRPAEGATVVLTAEGLQFSWLCFGMQHWPRPHDQVMVLAYFPELEKAAYLLYGATRLSRTELLPLRPDLAGAYMEVYISFISANRKQISNSTYLGNFNKPDS